VAKLIDQKIMLLGEAVLDLISIGTVDTLDTAESFSKFTGGEVANLAANLARIGFSSSLACCVGNDNFGIFIKKQLQAAGVDLSLMQTSNDQPTTLIPVTRTTATPDFSVYRGADQELSLNGDLLSAAKGSKAIHTSAFALSRDPCRSKISGLISLTTWLF
jgi:fructokinase